jgi:Stage II sporulation protein M
MAMEFWKASSSRRKRLLAVGAAFLLLIVVAAAGALTPISQQQAEEETNSLNETRQQVLNTSLLAGTLYIFRNNFVISLVTFIPFVGPFFGAMVMYNTGFVIGAETSAESFSLSPVLVLLLLFFYPFTWMEFLVYSIAFSESVGLAWSIIKRRAKNELVTALILILVCMVTLLAAALIEIVIIKALN